MPVGTKMYKLSTSQPKRNQDKDTMKFMKQSTNDIEEVF